MIEHNKKTEKILRNFYEILNADLGTVTERPSNIKRIETHEDRIDMLRNYFDFIIDELYPLGIKINF